MKLEGRESKCLVPFTVPTVGTKRKDKEKESQISNYKTIPGFFFVLHIKVCTCILLPCFVLKNNIHISNMPLVLIFKYHVSTKHVHVNL